jgi:hypothetical protein
MAVAVLAMLGATAGPGSAAEASGPATVGATGAAVAFPNVEDVLALPVGKQTTLPYADNRTRTIHDGSRTVSYAGLVGQLRQLYKVDGGYVIARSSTVNPCQLVFISSTGRRVQWDSGWDCVRGYPYPIPLVVSRSGGRITYNDLRGGVAITVVRDVSTGKVVRERTFPDGGRALADSGRVFVNLSSQGDAVWWDPVTNTTQSVATGIYATAVDVSAGQVFGNRSMHGLGAPGTPVWTYTEGIPINGGVWSTDDRLFAIVDEPDDLILNAEIHDADTGANVGGVTIWDVGGSRPVVWETPDTFLIDATHGYVTSPQGAIVRCRFSTSSCGRLPASEAFVVATRKPS